MTKSRQTKCQIRTVLQKPKELVYFYLVGFLLFGFLFGFLFCFTNSSLHKCMSVLLMACDVQDCAVN